MKRCTKCGREFPATAEYFYPSKHCKSGLNGSCKKCWLESCKTYQRDHPKREKPTFAQQDIARFWAKVDKTNGPDACWIWTANRNHKGYGMVAWRGIVQAAHRVSWEIAHGDPGILFVLHTCDHPWCVNPSHLFLGSNLDNIHDCMNKGRRAPVDNERNGNHKLSDAQVADIRERFLGSDVTFAALAREYGVTYQNIAYIIRGTTRRIHP